MNEGAILFPEYAVDSWGWNLLINTGLFDPDKKISKYTEKEMDALLHSKPMKIKTKFGANDVNLTFEGIVTRFTNKYIKRDLKTMSERTQKSVEPYMTMGPCSMCKGARLSQEALKCKINGYNIADLTSMEIPELIEVVKKIKDPVAEPTIRRLLERLSHLVDIGLEYLSLSRETDTLSGGESSRSTGGTLALRTAIQRPDVVKRLVVMSAPFKRTGMYPEVLAAMDQEGLNAEAMKNTPMYQSYAKIAPKPQEW